MPEANVAGKAPAAAEPAPITDDAGDWLPGIQRLWDETFGSLLKFCRDAAAADSARLAPPEGRADEEGRQEVAA
jgi:hypothetical protein